jgi:DNA-binding transcriptional LysR family regulator
MRKTNFDLDALRTLSVGVELGCFAKAADRLSRSTSAVSAQLKKLEEQAGTPILRKAGRGLRLTDAGELLMSYGRRMLELNDEAQLALGSAGLHGTVRLGLQEDFGESLLSDVLGTFARTHPAVHIEARIARNAELVSRMQTADLDLALAWQAGTATTVHAEQVGTFALHWIASEHWEKSGAAADGEPIPIVAMDAPCLLRRVATDALDKAGIAWRIVFTSPSLAGVWAAVAAGLGVTVRTHFGLPSRVRLLKAAEYALPALGNLDLMLYSAEAGSNPAAARLRSILIDCVGGRRVDLMQEGGRTSAQQGLLAGTAR